MMANTSLINTEQVVNRPGREIELVQGSHQLTLSTPSLVSCVTNNPSRHQPYQAFAMVTMLISHRPLRRAERSRPAIWER